MPATEQVAPLEAVTRYDNSGVPPVEYGADQETVVCPFPSEAVSASGGVGTPMKETLLLGDEGPDGPEPSLLLLTPVNV